MHYLHKKLFSSAISCFCLLSASLFAQEKDTFEVPSQDADERNIVGPRPSDPSIKNKARRELAAELKEEQNKIKSEKKSIHRASLNLNSEENLFRLAPSNSQANIHLASYYPLSAHWLSSFSNIDFSLEIEDGSRWQVHLSDTLVINRWRQGDQLVISPNDVWLSPGGYYITNKITNDSIRVNLSSGPTIFGTYSHWIVHIDHLSGHLTLENGVTWCIYNRDAYIFREWQVNDHIIIGTNYSYLSYYDHILINSNMDSHIRATQY